MHAPCVQPARGLLKVELRAAASSACTAMQESRCSAASARALPLPTPTARSQPMVCTACSSAAHARVAKLGNPSGNLVCKLVLIKLCSDLQVKPPVQCANPRFFNQPTLAGAASFFASSRSRGRTNAERSTSALPTRKWRLVPAHGSTSTDLL